jgi:hypothetical protein
VQESGDHGHCLDEFELSKVGAEAVVPAAAEEQDGWWCVAGDVETVGIVVDRRVTFGRCCVGDDARARRDEDTAEFD